MVIIITQFAAYDSYARLGLDNSACIVCQINSDANNNFFFFFSDDRLLVTLMFMNNNNNRRNASF